MKKTKIISIILILMGIATIAVPSFLEYRNEKERIRNIEDFVNEIEKEESGSIGNWSIYEKETPDPKDAESSIGGKKKKGKKDKRKKDDLKKKSEQVKVPDELSMDGTYAVGIIEIKAIHLQYLIYEGTDDAALSKGIGHLKGTANFGQTGNCVLAGHTGSYDGVFFNHLPDLKTGDEVTITTRNKEKFHYQVVAFLRTSPEDPVITEQMREEEGKRLTLLTCADGGESRFVCQCIQVAPANTDQEEKGGDA